MSVCKGGCWDLNFASSCATFFPSQGLFLLDLSKSIDFFLTEMLKQKRQRQPAQLHPCCQRHGKDEEFLV